MPTILEPLSLNAWPALEAEDRNGWRLCFSHGFSRRANSVQPLAAPADDLEESLRYCEAWYAARGRPAYFKMTVAAQPSGLDDFLAQRGYLREAPTSVQTRPLADAPDPELPAGFRFAAGTRVDEAWVARYMSMNGYDHRHHPIAVAIMRRIQAPCCYLSILREGETVAVGLGVAEDGWVGLFDIVTAPEYRGRGLGTQVVRELLRWGRAHGAHSAYLQVMQDNLPAQRLYARLGFTPRYEYWYRRGPGLTKGGSPPENREPNHWD